jgi:hypothetical protein
MEDEIELVLAPGEAHGPEDRAGDAAGEMPEELVIEARLQITFRCGKSSITLYPNGKIALRGLYILSDAEGVNRIAGGRIELN